MKLSKDDKAGLYITVIFHLAVIIVFLVVQIGVQIGKGGSTFVIDFSRQEEAELKHKALEKELAELERAQALKEAMERAVEQKMVQDPQSYRNIVTNSGKLKSIGHEDIDADDLARDVEKLREDLKSKPVVDDYGDASVRNSQPQDRQPKNEGSYKGPSVLDYNVGGRRARSLPVPAYKGYNGGQVKVLVKVNRSGEVTSATIDESASVRDSDLREYARQAALKSRFESGDFGADKSEGYIIYQFIHQ